MDISEICLQHLAALLSMERLQAIEWTPRTRLETGTDPKWGPLYPRFLDSGKSVQVLVADPEGVEPLLKEIGTGCIYLLNQGRTSNVYRIMEIVERIR